MTAIYRTIPQGKTQRATAEAIYAHLTAHPEDLPGIDVHTLTFRLDGTETAICVSDLTGTMYDAFPAVARDIHVEKGWSPSYGEDIGLGVMFTRALDHDPANTIRLLALVVRRTLRYRDKQTARNAVAVTA